MPGQLCLVLQSGLLSSSGCNLILTVSFDGDCTLHKALGASPNSDLDNRC